MADSLVVGIYDWWRDDEPDDEPDELSRADLRAIGLACLVMALIVMGMLVYEMGRFA